MKIDLLSPHSPVAAAQRLKAAVGDTLTPDTPKCVTGNGTETHMILWVHRPRFRNDLKTMLTATMEPHMGGTRIRGRLGQPLSGTLFMGCWFSFVSLFLLFGVVMFVTADGAARWTGVPFILVPLLMLGIGGVMLGIGRMHRREDQQMLLAFLDRTIGTRPFHRRDI